MLSTMDRPAFYRVFVYGTLLRGEPNHDLLARAKWVGIVRTRAEFDLFDLGRFPAMVAHGQTAISGEVYDTDEASLRRLDRLEGHPHFYTRTTIQLEDGQQAEAYVLREDQVQGAQRIVSGDWRVRGRVG